MIALSQHRILLMVALTCAMVVARPGSTQAAARQSDETTVKLSEIHVRVTWTDGTPAKRRGLELFQPALSNCFLRTIYGVTDDNGRCVLRAAPGVDSILYLHGNGPPKRLVPNSPDEAPLSVDMMLERGRVVVGRVVDIDGHPVAGAAILLAENAGGTRVVEVTQSDREGRYRVQLSGSQDIAAHKDGHVDSWTYTTFGNTTPEMTLEIPLRGPAARVEGIVTDVDGTAIAGAQVLIGQERRSTIGRIVEAPPPFHARSAPPARVLTDAHGRFVVNTLSPDRTLVAVRALGFAPWSEHRAFTAGRTTDLELRLERGARVRGMVTDALGKPVAGALILQGERYGCFLGNQSRTDTNGRFEITSLPIDTFSLTASSKNVGRVHRIFETVGAGEEFEWHPFLGAGPGVSGRLADASGKALTDWSISLLFPIDDYNERGLYTTTNDAGVFHFRDVGKREYRLEVRGPRARFVSAVRDGISASSAPLSLRLTEEQMPLSTIRGKIDLGDSRDSKTLTLLKSEDKTLFG
ncbi:MAG: carboxypeptidase regulatory-like domain-containing protein, partial [Planctomycetes bacterium]|nr:carboxypeptidase regulatory-like domain-containing protein [Planctomycetota bacterium]